MKILLALVFTLLSGVAFGQGSLPRNPSVIQMLLSRDPAVPLETATKQYVSNQKITGCVGDGVADDTVCVQAAINAAAIGHYTLHPGGHFYGISGTLTGPSSVLIECEGRGVGGTVGGSGFRAIVPNVSMFVLPSFSRMEHCMIDMGNSITQTNTSGVAINLPAGTQSTVLRDLYLEAPCVGIDVNGSTHSLTDIVVNDYTGAACGGYRVGHGTAFANTSDIRLTNFTGSGKTGGTAGNFGLRIEDCGGCNFLFGDLLFSTYGTIIQPGITDSQTVWWAFFSNVALGDTTVLQPLLIDTIATTSVIRGLKFEGTWTASSQSTNGITIQSTSGAAVTGVYFSNHRDYNNFGGDIIINNSLTDIDLDSSHLCGSASGGSAYGVTLNTGASIRIHGGEIGGSCSGFSTSLAAAVSFMGSNNSTIILGADLSLGNGQPFSGGPSGSSIIQSNLGVDGAIISVASAATVVLPVNPLIQITGTTNITSLLGGWNGRQATLIPVNSITISGCSSVTTVPGVPVTATFGGCWYFK